MSEIFNFNSSFATIVSPEQVSNNSSISESEISAGKRKRGMKQLMTFHATSDEVSLSDLSINERSFEKLKSLPYFVPVRDKISKLADAFIKVDNQAPVKINKHLELFISAQSALLAKNLKLEKPWSKVSYQLRIIQFLSL
jgi:hypothetical protein